jgi:hypothetical protein
MKNSRYRSLFSDRPGLAVTSSKTCWISNLKTLTMMSDSSYYSSETESDRSFGAVNFDSIVDEAEAWRVSGRATARKKQRLESKPHAVMPSNLHSVVIMDKHIPKCLLGQDYDYNASLRVVGAALHMQKAHLQKVVKLGKIKGKLVEKPWI